MIPEGRARQERTRRRGKKEIIRNMLKRKNIRQSGGVQNAKRLLNTEKLNLKNLREQEQWTVIKKIKMSKKKQEK